MREQRSDMCAWKVSGQANSEKHSRQRKHCTQMHKGVERQRTFEEIQDNARCKGKRKESDFEELGILPCRFRFVL